MKQKTLMACLALLLSASVSGFSGDKANLSGTWTLDKDKSFSNGPEFDQTMTITHSGEKVGNRSAIVATSVKLHGTSPWHLTLCGWV
jgi:hypothetical protein